mmetsp:Transcript_69265/g.144411  ORF Transcript_69265/g.144411 Transcript_69265/m.144411 type:complete len:111 (+) Transcript_69265:3233-3565(+)
MVKKKVKKDNQGISNKLRLIVKSGKFSMGYKTTIRKLKDGRCKLIIVADNCPPGRRLELEYYAMLNKCSIHHFFGNNSELGVACGKIFRCSCFGVIDSGDADLSSLLNGL